MLKVISCFAVSALALFVGINNYSGAQKSAGASEDATLTNRQLENVKIKAQGVGQLFTNLSLSYNVPIGLEIASDDDESAVYHLSLKKGTLPELLTQFTARHDQYTWDMKDGVVNVFPKDGRRDPLFRELLETTVSSFTVNRGSDCWSVTDSLAAAPEIKQVLENNGTAYRRRGFTGAYIPQLGRNFKLEVSNMTLRSILNKLIKESPTARLWLITRNSNDHTLFMSLRARHEGLPTGD